MLWAFAFRKFPKNISTPILTDKFVRLKNIYMTVVHKNENVRLIM